MLTCALTFQSSQISQLTTYSFESHAVHNEDIHSTIGIDRTSSSDQRYLKIRPVLPPGKSTAVPTKSVVAPDHSYVT